MIIIYTKKCGFSHYRFMKRPLLILFVVILFSACSTSKFNKDGIRYFDENNEEVTKSKFKRVYARKSLFIIPGDSINQVRLTVRENHGRLDKRAALESILEKQIDREIDADKPMLVIYYPGKDKCNSTGSATKETRRIWYNELEEKLYKIAQIKPIYIYKSNNGLEKYDGILTYHKDPNRIIERLFFQYHYPCSSFVVISKNGDYISYYGEFPKEHVWKLTKEMNK